MRLIRLLVMAGAVVGAVSGAIGAQSTAARPTVTRAQIDRWMSELSNWGRWGPADRIGTLNLITPAKRQQAVALARTGTVVSLERPVPLAAKPEETRVDGKPAGVTFYEIRFRTFPKGDPRGNEDYTSDVQEFHVHGGMTHLDALCHYSDGTGRTYNGYSLKDTVTEEAGCTRLGLDNVGEGIVTRGIIVDMTRLTVSAAGQPGRAVYPEDIEAWERQTGLTVSSGDALFVYNPAPDVPGSPRRRGGGFDVSVAPWMRARDVALTSGLGSIPEDPHAGHRLALVAMGMYLLDGPDLEELADTAARLGRWEFMLVVSPIRVPGSTGSMVNPLAIF